MKVSICLPGEDLEFLDSYAMAGGFQSRSAVLHEAVRLLRGTTLESGYEEALQDWEVTVKGGIESDASR